MFARLSEAERFLRQDYELSPRTDEDWPIIASYIAPADANISHVDITMRGIIAEATNRLLPVSVSYENIDDTEWVTWRAAETHPLPDVAQETAVLSEILIKNTELLATRGLLIAEVQAVAVQRKANLK